MFRIANSSFNAVNDWFSSRWLKVGRRAILMAGVGTLCGGALHAQALSASMAEKGTLTFSPIPAHAFGDAPFAIRAASSAPGTITYSVLGGPAMLSDNNMLTITGGGTIYLEAREAAPGDQKPLTAEISFPVSTPTSATLTFTRTPAVKARFSSDTPNYPFLDSDGKFFLQNADSQYDKVPANHVWDFYSGTNEQAKNLALSKANSQFDTEALCEQGSPVYKALYDVKGVTPGEKGYADGNFCDLVGVWVDPDTGDWYGVVHNELYPNIPRIDVISYGISKNHGRTWDLEGPIVTSPYGLTHQKSPYFYYGEGDPRLVVDTSSGYFYLFYNSRIMSGRSKGFSAHEWEHVSRAPISKKMAPDSWEKFYNGAWSQMIGSDWTCDARETHPCPKGAVASSLATSIGADNDPTMTQTLVQPAEQQAEGDLTHYTNSVLHTASISWNVALGKYIAFAEDRKLFAKSGDYDAPSATLKFYVSDDLTKQQWTYAGEVPYQNASWYRWMVDAGNLTSTKTIGSTFLAYCSVSCSNPKNDSEYIRISLALDGSATQPTYLTAEDGSQGTPGAYIIRHPKQAELVSAREAAWIIRPVSHDPGFFYIRYGATYLGVAGGDKGRAWGAPVRRSPLLSSADSAPVRSRQQWYFERIENVDGRPTSENLYRVINRCSGLALSVSSDAVTSEDLSNVITAPIRNWDADPQEQPTRLFHVWKASEQAFVLVPVGAAAQ